MTLHVHIARRSKRWTCFSSVFRLRSKEMVHFSLKLTISVIECFAKMQQIAMCVVCFEFVHQCRNTRRHTAQNETDPRFNLLINYTCVSIRFTLFHFHTRSQSLVLVMEINLITFTRSVHHTSNRRMNGRKLIIHNSHTCSKSCESFLIIPVDFRDFFAVGWTRKVWAKRKHLDRLKAMRSSILIWFKWKTQFQYSQHVVFSYVFLSHAICVSYDAVGSLSNVNCVCDRHRITCHMTHERMRQPHDTHPITNTHSKNNQINTLTAVTSCRVLFLCKFEMRACAIRLFGDRMWPPFDVRTLIPVYGRTRNYIV